MSTKVKTFTSDGTFNVREEMLTKVKRNNKIMIEFKLSKIKKLCSSLRISNLFIF